MSNLLINRFEIKDVPMDKFQVPNNPRNSCGVVVKDHLIDEFIISVNVFEDKEANIELADLFIDELEEYIISNSSESDVSGSGL